MKCACLVVYTNDVGTSKGKFTLLTFRLIKPVGSFETTLTAPKREAELATARPIYPQIGN